MLWHASLVETAAATTQPELRVDKRKVLGRLALCKECLELGGDGTDDVKNVRSTVLHFGANANAHLVTFSRIRPFMWLVWCDAQNDFLITIL